MARSQDPRLQQVVEAKLDEQELSYLKGFSKAAADFYKVQKTALQKILNEQSVQERKSFFDNGFESNIEKLKSLDKRTELKNKLAQLKAKKEQLDDDLRKATKAHSECLASQANALQDVLVKDWKPKAEKVKQVVLTAASAYLKKRKITTVEEARDKLKEKFLSTGPTGHKNEIFSIVAGKVCFRKDIGEIENYKPEVLRTWLNSIISNTGNSGVAYETLTEIVRKQGVVLTGKKGELVSSFVHSTDSLETSLTTATAETVRKIEESTQSVNAIVKSLNESIADLDNFSKEINNEIAAEQVRLEQERLAAEQRKREEELRKKEEEEKQRQLELKLAEEKRQREQAEAQAKAQAEAEAAYAAQMDQLKKQAEAAETQREERKQVLESLTPPGSPKKGPKTVGELEDSIRALILQTTDEGARVYSDDTSICKAGYKAILALRPLLFLEEFEGDLRKLESALGLPVPVLATKNVEQSIDDITDWANLAGKAAQKANLQKSSSFVMEPHRPVTPPVPVESPKKIPEVKRAKSPEQVPEVKRAKSPEAVHEVKIDIKDEQVDTASVLNQSLEKVASFLRRQIDSLEQKGQAKRAEYLQSLRQQVDVILLAKNSEELHKSVNRNALSLPRINKEFGIDPKKSVSGEEAARPLAAGFNALFRLKDTSFNTQAKLSKSGSENISKYVASLENNSVTTADKRNNLETLTNLVTPGARSTSSAFVEGVKVFGSSTGLVAGGGGTALGILHWIGAFALASAIPFAGWVALSIASPILLGYSAYRLINWLKGPSDSTVQPTPTAASTRSPEAKRSVAVAVPGSPITKPGTPTQSPKTASSTDSSPRSPVSPSERKYSSLDDIEVKTALRLMIAEFARPQQVGLDKRIRENLVKDQNAVCEYWGQKQGRDCNHRLGVIGRLAIAIDDEKPLEHLIAIAKDECARSNKPNPQASKTSGHFWNGWSTWFSGKNKVKPEESTKEKRQKEFLAAIAAIETDGGKQLETIANTLNTEIHSRHIPVPTLR